MNRPGTNASVFTTVSTRCLTREGLRGAYTQPCEPESGHARYPARPQAAASRALDSPEVAARERLRGVRSDLPHPAQACPAILDSMQGEKSAPEATGSADDSASRCTRTAPSQLPRGRLPTAEPTAPRGQTPASPHRAERIELIVPARRARGSETGGSPPGC